MASSYLILCHPLLLLPPIPPSIRVFSNKSTLCMRWPKDCSFSFNIIPSKEHPGLINLLQIGLVGSPCSPRNSQESSPTPQFIIGNWNAKVGSQEIPGVTGKFGLGIQNEAGQRLKFAKRTNWSQQTPSSNNIRKDSTHGHHQMVNTKITLIILFVAEVEEALYSQQK